MSSEEVAWKVRTKDLEVKKVLTERRAAIESGKLKGRRLSEEVKCVTEVGFGRHEATCSGGLEIGLVQAREVRSVLFSYDLSDTYEDEASCPHCHSYSSSSSSSLCAENSQKRIPGNVGSRRWKVIMIRLAVSVPIVCIFAIISRMSFGIYEDEHQLILTPT